jgi:hypothetical protein
MNAIKNLKQRVGESLSRTQALELQAQRAGFRSYATFRAVQAQIEKLASKPRS